jgi:hypothetical protein
MHDNIILCSKYDYGDRISLRRKVVEIRDPKTKITKQVHNHVATLVTCISSIGVVGVCSSSHGDIIYTFDLENGKEIQSIPLDSKPIYFSGCDKTGMFAVLTETKVLLIFTLNRVNNKLVFVRSEFLEKAGHHSKLKISKCGNVLGVSTKGNNTPMTIFDSFMHRLPGLLEETKNSKSGASKIGSICESYSGSNNRSITNPPKVPINEEPVVIISFDFIRKQVFDKLRLCTAHRDSKIHIWSYSGYNDGWEKIQTLSLVNKSSISSIISVDYIPEVDQIFFSDTHGFIWNSLPKSEMDKDKIKSTK